MANTAADNRHGRHHRHAGAGILVAFSLRLRRHHAVVAAPFFHLNLVPRAAAVDALHVGRGYGGVGTLPVNRFSSGEEAFWVRAGRGAGASVGGGARCGRRDGGVNGRGASAVARLPFRRRPLHRGRVPEHGRRSRLWLGSSSSVVVYRRLWLGSGVMWWRRVGIRVWIGVWIQRGACSLCIRRWHGCIPAVSSCSVRRRTGRLRGMGSVIHRVEAGSHGVRCASCGVVHIIHQFVLWIPSRRRWCRVVASPTVTAIVATIMRVHSAGISGHSIWNSAVGSTIRTGAIRCTRSSNTHVNRATRHSRVLAVRDRTLCRGSLCGGCGCQRGIVVRGVRLIRGLVARRLGAVGIGVVPVCVQPGLLPVPCNVLCCILGLLLIVQ